MGHAVCQPSGLHDRAERLLTQHPSCAAGVEQLASICEQERSCAELYFSLLIYPQEHHLSPPVVFQCPALCQVLSCMSQSSSRQLLPNTVLLFLLLIFLLPCQSDDAHPVLSTKTHSNLSSGPHCRTAETSETLAVVTKGQAFSLLFSRKESWGVKVGMKGRNSNGLSFFSDSKFPLPFISLLKGN